MRCDGPPPCGPSNSTAVVVAALARRYAPQASTRSCRRRMLIAAPAFSLKYARCCPVIIGAGAVPLKEGLANHPVRGGGQVADFGLEARLDPGCVPLFYRHREWRHWACKRLQCAPDCMSSLTIPPRS